MKRALAGLGVAAFAAAALAGEARAQVNAEIFVAATGDSVATGLTTGVTAVPVQLVNSGCTPGYYCYYDATAANFTVFFDPARVEVLGVQPAAFATVNATIGTGTVQVSASGYAYGYQNAIVNLMVRLLPAATDGAYLWIRAADAQYQYYGSSYYFYLVQNRVGEVCHATQIWGDVDASGSIDSRDALITLSAAVGLPVSGFTLSLGDVDGDGLANSRDALMMLSYAISLPITQTNRVGLGIADACPGLTAPGETVVFRRSGAAPGLYRLDSLSTSPVFLTGSAANDDQPRLSNAGTAVVFRGTDTTGTWQIFRMDAAGGGRRQLSPSDATRRFAPDWSPDGSRITYLYGGSGSTGTLYTMDSAGAAVQQVGYSPITADGLRWSRTAGLLTFANGSGISSATADSVGSITSVTMDWPGVGAGGLAWSPDGTWIAFLYGTTFVSHNTIGAYGLPIANFTGAIQGFDWGARGIVMSLPDRHGLPSLWLLQGGRDGPIVRLTRPGAGEGDYQPSFRRDP